MSTKVSSHSRYKTRCGSRRRRRTQMGRAVGRLFWWCKLGFQRIPDRRTRKSFKHSGTALRGYKATELSTGSFCVTRSDPTHQLTYPTHYKWKILNPTRPNQMQLTMELTVYKWPNPTRPNPWVKPTNGQLCQAMAPTHMPLSCLTDLPNEMHLGTVVLIHDRDVACSDAIL